MAILLNQTNDSVTYRIKYNILYMPMVVLVAMNSKFQTQPREYRLKEPPTSNQRVLQAEELSDLMLEASSRNIDVILEMCLAAPVFL